eukprot:PhF_6_TR25182/c0_g2_i1/m.34747
MGGLPACLAQHSIHQPIIIPLTVSTILRWCPTYTYDSPTLQSIRCLEPLETMDLPEDMTTEYWELLSETACKYGHTDLVNYLLQGVAPLLSNNPNILHNAMTVSATMGHSDIIQKLCLADPSLL